MANRNRARARQDGEPTADELKRRAENCAGFTPSDADAEICGQCGGHPGHHAGANDGIENLAETLPPDSRTAAEQPSAEAVADRQAEAREDSAPPAGGATFTAPPVDEAANRLARVEIVRAKMERLDAIAGEIKALNDEKDTIMGELETESGFQRTAVSAVRKLKGLGSAAAIRKHLDNRGELEAIFIKPILDGAEAGQADE